jgi:phage terminase large subunit
MILHLQATELHITKDSPNFIFEKENYQWAVGSDGKPTNTEIDKHNHLFKALMYGYWHTTKAQNSVTSMSAKTLSKYA